MKKEYKNIVIGDYTYEELESHFLCDEIQTSGEDSSLWWGFQAPDGGLSLIRLTKEQWKLFNEVWNRRWNLC